MNAQRRVKLCRNGRNQAVRIPREFDLPGEEAVMRRESDRLVIELSAASGPNARLPAVLASLSQLGPDDRFPEVADSIADPVSAAPGDRRRGRRRSPRAPARAWRCHARGVRAPVMKLFAS